MKKFLIAISVSMLVSSGLLAQNDLDALRYSQTGIGGTARSIGAGGAFGALGGDFGGLGINPAGVAQFQSNQLTFSPSVTSIKSASTFMGGTQTEVKPNFNINGFGVEWVAKFKDNGEKKSNWRNVNFAFNMNRLNNFNSSQFYSGFNPNGSLLDLYTPVINGTSPSQVYSNHPYGIGLAYDTYLLNPGTGSDSLKYNSVTGGKGTQQQQFVTTRGNTNEYLFSFGGNYKDKLYIGAGIGIPTVHYENETSYTESDLNNNIPYFENFTLANRLVTNGTGVNARFGLIYHINDYLRIGGSFQSPTYYYMTDNYNSSITSNLDTGIGHTSSSPDGKYSYNLYTPWKVTGSLALVFKKYGFISVDYEYQDYSQSSYGVYNGSASDETYFNQVNDTIQKRFGAVSNLRIGGELILDKIFRVRLGYDMYGTPFSSGQRSSNSYNNSSQTFSGGLGISDNGVFLDIAYARTQVGQLQPSSLPDTYDIVSGVNTKTWYNNVVLTVGFRW